MGTDLRRLAVVLALAACSPGDEIKEDDFANQMAGVLCDRLSECARGVYLASYYGHADCVASIEDDLQALVDFEDDIDCDYSNKQAAEAWHAIRDMSCEDFYEGDADDEIADVWDTDCGGFQTNTVPYYGR